MTFDYFEEVENPITVCDANGIILYMNAASRQMLSKYGEQSLIGKSLYNCHNENSNRIIRELFEQKKSNTYMVEKEGKRKLVHQTPWFENGQLAGLIEMITFLPEDLKVIKR
jgi:PAS domain S-box-containing protein